MARETVEDGLAGMWLSQVFSLDSLTALALVAADTPGIELGTSVVPIYGRHPIVLAMQALTAEQATGGRLVLGVGPSHQLVVEMLFGESYAKPYSDTAAYLDALAPLLRGGGAVTIDAPPPPVLLAALGPRMLRLAAAKADGVALWMTGPKTIADRVAADHHRGSDPGRHQCVRHRRRRSSACPRRRGAVRLRHIACVPGGPGRRGRVRAGGSPHRRHRCRGR